MWLFALVLLTGAGCAFAHGIGYRQVEKGTVALEFFYSTGEAMGYREAKVFSPQDEKIAYQSGRTDASGRFAFVPDVPGEWRIAVKDDEGHSVTATVSVGEGIAPVSRSSIPEGLELYLRAALGVSVLFNIAAGVLLLRNKKGRHPGGEG